jgi:hypothetical protein
MLDCNEPVDIPKLRRNLSWAHLADVTLQSIPVDKRHNAKIDYTALAKQLN